MFNCSFHATYENPREFSNRSVRKPEKLFGIDFQNHFISMMGIMQEKDQIYHRAMNEIDIITSLIDEELKGK